MNLHKQVKYFACLVTHTHDKPIDTLYTTLIFVGDLDLNYLKVQGESKPNIDRIPITAGMGDKIHYPPKSHMLI